MEKSKSLFLPKKQNSHESHTNFKGRRKTYDPLSELQRENTKKKNVKIRASRIDDLVRPRSPTLVFTSRESLNLSRRPRSPGPVYKPRRLTMDPSWTMGSKIDHEDKVNSPGPIYDTSKPNDAPKFSIKPKRKDNAEKVRSPGPMAYDLSRSQKSSLPNYSFRLITKDFIDKMTLGLEQPGFYSGPDSTPTSPSWSLGLRHDEAEKKPKGPGPMKYNPNYKATTKQQPSYRISTTPRFGDSSMSFLSSNPGPADYCPEYDPDDFHQRLKKRYKKGKKQRPHSSRR